MKKTINPKAIIKDNPFIKEKEFNVEQIAIQKRKGMSKQVKYNIVPPFTTENQMHTAT